MLKNWTETKEWGETQAPLTSVVQILINLMQFLSLKSLMKKKHRLFLAKFYRKTKEWGGVFEHNH